MGRKKEDAKMGDVRLDHKKGHRKRLRDRFVVAGPDSLAEHELVELILQFAMPYCDTKEVAKRVLHEFGSLHALLEASVPELMVRCNWSEYRATLVASVVPIARRVELSRQKKGSRIKSSAAVIKFARALFIGENVECFYIITFDNKMRLLKPHLIARGTIDWVEPYVRNVNKFLVNSDAKYFIIAHNHPSGDPMLSASDREFTDFMQGQARLSQTKLIDHIIIGDDSYFSFAERNLMKCIGIEGALAEVKINEKDSLEAAKPKYKRDKYYYPYK